MTPVLVIDTSVLFTGFALLWSLGGFFKPAQAGQATPTSRGLIQGVQTAPTVNPTPVSIMYLVPALQTPSCCTLKEGGKHLSPLAEHRWTQPSTPLTLQPTTRPPPENIRVEDSTEVLYPLRPPSPSTLEPGPTTPDAYKPHRFGEEFDSFMETTEAVDGPTTFSVSQDPLESSLSPFGIHGDVKHIITGADDDTKLPVPAVDPNPVDEVTAATLGKQPAVLVASSSFPSTRLFLYPPFIPPPRLPHRPTPSYQGRMPLIPEASTSVSAPLDPLLTGNTPVVEGIPASIEGSRVLGGEAGGTLGISGPGQAISHSATPASDLKDDHHQEPSMAGTAIGMRPSSSGISSIPGLPTQTKGNHSPVGLGAASRSIQSSVERQPPGPTSQPSNDSLTTTSSSATSHHPTSAYRGNSMFDDVRRPHTISRRSLGICLSVASSAVMIFLLTFLMHRPCYRWARGRHQDTLVGHGPRVNAGRTIKRVQWPPNVGVSHFSEEA